MRRGIPVVVVFVALIVVGIVVALEVGDSLFVTVRSTELRDSPGFLSPIAEVVPFGSEVSYLESAGEWHRVLSPQSGIEGWIHATAVRENGATQLQLQGEQTTRTVTSREIALAGRGFSENLEQEYGEDRELDFSRVDELEARAIDPSEIVVFVRDARLREDFLVEAE